MQRFPACVLFVQRKFYPGKKPCDLHVMKKFRATHSQFVPGSFRHCNVLSAEGSRKITYAGPCFLGMQICSLQLLMVKPLTVVNNPWALAGVDAGPR